MNAPLFQQLQHRFLAHLRQPSPENLPPGFTAERLTVYAELLYNKFDESLRACFPVLHSILSQHDWQALLRDFIAEHRCLSPYYRQIPDEFVSYLHHERRNPDDLPFIPELAHFEWIELQLSIREAEPFVIEPQTGPQLQAGVPVFAPVMQLLHYRWPVQAIKPAFRPAEAPLVATHILGFRNLSDQVRFILLNPATARLLIRLQNGLTGLQALNDMGEGLTAEQRAELSLFGQSVLADLHQQGVIINIRPLINLENRNE